MIIWSALLVVVASMFVLYPFFHSFRDSSSQSSVATARQANVDSYRIQIQLYDRQLELQEISSVEHQQLVNQAQSLLLVNTNSGVDSVLDRGNSGAWMVPVLLIFLPLLTYVFYDDLGAFEDQNIADMLRAQVQASEQRLSDDLIVALQQRVQERPDNVVYWAMLAQSAIDKNDIRQANGYYAEALKSAPGDSFLLAQYAESLFLIDGSQFTPRVASAVDRAFIADADNSTVLGLKGIEAFGARDLHQAIKYWRQAQRGIEPNSVVYQGLQSGIDRAMTMIEAELATSSQVKVSVYLSADDSISAQPTQSVFVAALSADGPPVPLAAIKLSFAQLPTQVELSDADALVSDHLLSSASEIRLVARLSATGSATPQPGDWEASTDVFTLSSEGLSTSMVINKLRQ